MLTKATCVWIAASLHAGAAGVCFLVTLWQAPPSAPPAPPPPAEINIRLGSSGGATPKTDEPAIARVAPAGESSNAPRTADPLVAREKEIPALEPGRPGAATEHVSVVAVHTPEPPYPRLARKRGWEGTLMVEFKIATDGTCFDVVVVESSGHAVLDQAAVETVAGWRFQTSQNAGVVSRRQRFRFRLQ